MLVSCNETLGMYLGILLKRMGFGLISSQTGPEASSLIRAVQPDIIIIDSELEVFDGLDTLERIREGGPSVPPVIMLAGAPTEETERRCLAAGACTVVAKPVSMQELHQALQECLFTMRGVKRRHVRAKVDIKVTVYHDGSELDLFTESISAGGAFIRHERPLPVGTIVDIFLPLGDEECLFLAGRVVYNNKKPCRNTFGFCQGFAVEFIEPGLQDTEAMEDFVSRFMTEDLAGAQAAEKAGSLGKVLRASGGAGNGVYAAIKSYLTEHEAAKKE